MQEQTHFEAWAWFTLAGRDEATVVMALLIPHLFPPMEVCIEEGGGGGAKYPGFMDDTNGG